MMGKDIQERLVNVEGAADAALGFAGQAKDLYRAIIAADDTEFEGISVHELAQAALQECVSEAATAMRECVALQVWTTDEVEGVAPTGQATSTAVTKSRKAADRALLMLHYLTLLSGGRELPERPAAEAPAEDVESVAEALDGDNIDW